jgi:hypothetical protein
VQLTILGAVILVYVIVFHFRLFVAAVFAFLLLLASSAACTSLACQIAYS